MFTPFQMCAENIIHHKNMIKRMHHIAKPRRAWPQGLARWQTHHSAKRNPIRPAFKPHHADGCFKKCHI